MFLVKSIAKKADRGPKGRGQKHRNSDTFRGEIVKNKPLFYCCFSNEFSM